ncbi:HdeD family acid-resistance protein [Cryptosporangium phraense]|uniref:HdeD family acid-resistance protein n=1 Tax=Cryptosporangium phraense TaxID=2593070 RepID=A0A545APW6_9ACTN|nr:DUF308 domain-containing protein [Cryptosporangium phraense]TQS43372.1 HdeD family acid-resistance protein [Cryptosporangium phraense]
MRNLTGSLVLKGALSLIIGLIAVVWPAVTIEAFVILFAVYAFMLAGTELMRAFASRDAGPVIGRILLALLDAVAGVAALVWPGITALALTLLVAGWALVAGAVEFGLVFGAGRTAGERALWGLSGLVSLAFGVVLVIRPDLGAVTLAQVYGLFSIVSGVSTLVLAGNVGTVAREPAPRY